MSTEYDKDRMDDDFKDLKEHVEHLERGVSTQDAEIPYPEALRNMPEAPSREMLQEGYALVKSDAALKTGASFKKEWRLALICVPYLVSSLGCGFDNGATGITAAMPAFLLYFGGFDPVTHSLSIESKWISLWGSMTQLAIAFGAMSCSWFLERWGPKKTNFGASVFILPAIAVQVFANSHGMLLAGKMLGGFPNGIFVASAANFISEACTQNLRPMMSSLLALCGLIGVTCGIATGFERIPFVTSDWLSWRLVLAIQWIFPAITVAGLIFVPTSPVYLVKRGQPAEAAKAIARLHDLKDESTIRARLAVVQHTVAMEQQSMASVGAASIKDLFRNKVDRRRTLITLGVWVCFNMAGAGFLGSGLYFLQQQGLNIVTATQITLGMLALSGLTNILVGYCLQKFGRRFCFVYCNAFHCLVLTCLGCLGFAKNKAAGWGVAVVLNFAICTAQLSTGGASFALNAEISSLRLRAKTVSLGFFSSYLGAWFTAFVTPYLFQDPLYLGAKTALIYAGATGLGVVWAYFYIPETNGRTAAEIDMLFEQGVPARKWKGTDIAHLMASREE